MDYKNIADAIRLCGSEPGHIKCRMGCPYFAGKGMEGMKKCIPRMTADAAAAIDELLERVKAAEARCTRLEEARERANEACEKWEARAEQAEKELDEAIEVICSHCTNFPCKTDACQWWRGKKDDNK